MLKTSSDKTGCCQTSSRSFAASPKATSSGSTGGSFYSETSATMKKKSLVWIICSRCPWCGRTTCSWAAGQKHKHWPGIICWHAFTWRFCEIQTRECEKEKSELWDKSPWRKQAYYEMLNCLHLLCNICDNLPRRTFMKVLVLRTPFSGSFSFRFIIYICVYVYIYIRLTRRAVFQLYYQFPDLLLKDHVLSCVSSSVLNDFIALFSLFVAILLLICWIKECHVTVHVLMLLCRYNPELLERVREMADGIDVEDAPVFKTRDELIKQQQQKVNNPNAFPPILHITAEVCTIRASASTNKYNRWQM